MAVPVKTVVGVPVPYRTRDEVVAAIAGGAGNGSPAFVFAGDMIVEHATAEVLELEIYEHDDDLRHAFEVASPYSTLTETDFEAIDRHGLCLYLVDDRGGSIEAARRMIRFAGALLERGGLAVKVESTGKAHSRSEWLDFAARTADDARVSIDALHEAFVVLVGSARNGYACGMHNLGLPDAACSRTPPGQDLGALLWAFTRYLLIEEPDLRDGHTFSLAPDAPCFRLELRPTDQFDPEDVFFNPFGAWHLTPLD